MTPLSVRFGLKHILGQASSAEMGGDYDGALSSYRAAASQFQQSAQAHLAIVRVLIRLGRREEALESCLNAERLLKTNCDVQRSLFLLYCQFGRLNNAFDCLVCLNNWGEDVAEELAHIGLRFAQNGDWSRRQELNLLLENRLRSKKGCILDPYYLLSVSDDTELHRIMADSIVAAISRQWLGIREQAKKTVEDPSSRRLRIGYLGGDFNSHATSLLLTNVLECHNRRNVEVIGYDYSHEDGSAIRKRMLRAFDRVVTVGAGDPRRDALNIARDSVDILVDTKGYTRASKSELLAFRPAPVQVNFLGYVGTQGAPWIDYVIADERVAPLSEASNWAEKFAYMPSSYYPNSRERPIPASRTASGRLEYGLPNDCFVYGCFNGSYKVTPTLFDSWIDILTRVPQSVLWLFEENSSVAANFRMVASKRGLNSDRLIFARPMEFCAHMMRYAYMDLFLDTTPYGAHTTAADALWAGVPIVTLQGQSFASRVGASLLTAVGLDELICKTAIEYVELAVSLADCPERLGQYKATLNDARDQSTLFDSPQFADNLESLYRTMAERNFLGLKPDHIFATPSSPRHHQRFGISPNVPAECQKFGLP